jgi:hypothetical protein
VSPNNTINSDWQDRCALLPAGYPERKLITRCESVSTSEFVIETDPTPEQIQYLEDRLYEFNSEATGITDGQGLAIFVKDKRIKSSGEFVVIPGAVVARSASCGWRSHGADRA